MKLAAVYVALNDSLRQTVVHTGQHYDSLMSDIFFEQLGLPAPHVNLGVGSTSHAVQTGEIMIRLEPVLVRDLPNMVMVYGDVNSTIAAALVCSKIAVRVGHVEAGLRSGDWRMPEEINRRITDVLADLLFTPSEDADENLVREGTPTCKIHRVGNVMIDTLVRLLPMTDPAATRERLGIAVRFALVTLHRPSNVDDPEMLTRILAALADLATELDVVFPIHPRTRLRMAQLGFRSMSRLHLIDPLGYLDFLALQRGAVVVITDSGGIQEETTYLGVPCITIRENTERPITLTLGTNVLVGGDMQRLRAEFDRALSGAWQRGRIPPMWDGRAGQRIASIVLTKAV